MLFKKGNMGDVNNYRGISIVNSFSKVYDYIKQPFNVMV